MKIQLKEIPEDGRHYHFNRTTAELNADLKDLIEDREYDIQFAILPLSDHYELRGQVIAYLPQVCSRCGCDFEMPLNEGFKELIMVVPHHDRKEKTSRVNHISDLFSEGPMVTELHSFELDVGEFFHQFFALAEPILPICSADCKGICLQCGAALNVENCRCDASTQEDPVAHPFSALKDLKLN
jgi:uncharacterized protein